MKFLSHDEFMGGAATEERPETGLAQPVEQQRSEQTEQSGQDKPRRFASHEEFLGLGEVPFPRERPRRPLDIGDLISPVLEPVTRAVTAADATFEKFGNQLLRGILSIPEPSLPAERDPARHMLPGVMERVAPADVGLTKDAALSALMQLRGIYKSVTGGDLEITDENVQGLAGRDISPEIAEASGRIMGGIALLTGVGAAVRARRLNFIVGNMLYKHPRVAFLAGPMAEYGVQFATTEAFLNAINQVRDGTMSLGDLGMAALKGGGIGAVFGRIAGMPGQTAKGALAKIAGASAFGFGHTIVSGGSVQDAMVSGATFAAIMAMGHRGALRTVQAGAMMRARATSVEMAMTSARAKGYGEATVHGIGRAAGIEFDVAMANAGGIGSVNVANATRIMRDMRRSIDSIVAAGKPTQTAPAAPARITGPAAPATAPATPPAAPAAPPPTPQAIAVARRRAVRLDRAIARAQDPADPLSASLRPNLPALQQARAELQKVIDSAPATTAGVAPGPAVTPETAPETAMAPSGAPAVAPAQATSTPISDPAVIRGRMNKLVDEQESLLREMDAIEAERAALKKAGRPTKAIENELEKMAEQYNQLDIEMGDILTSRPDILRISQPGAQDPVQLPASEIRRIERVSRQAGASAERQQLREMVKDKEADINAVKAEIVTYANKHLPKEERGKMLATVKNAKTLADLDKAVRRIDEIAETSAQKRLTQRILDELDTTKAKRVSGKPVGKYTPQIQRVLDSMRKAADMTADEAEAKISANIGSLDNPMKTPDGLATENAILRLMGGLKGRSAAEQAQILEQVRDVKAAGRTLRNLLRTEKKERKERIVENIVNEVTGEKGLAPGAATFGVKDVDKVNTTQSAINTFGRRLVMAWDDVTNILSGKSRTRPGESEIERFSDVFKETRAQEAGEGAASVRVAEAAKKAFGVASDNEVIRILREGSRPTLLGRFKNAVGVEDDLVLSKGQARQLWATMKDPTLRETFDAEHGMAYTPEIRAAIDKFLTPQDKAFANAELDIYKEMYPRVNAVYSSMYGIDLPYNPNYIPIKRADIGYATPSGFTEFMQEMSFRRSVTSGSLKSRVENIRPLQMNDDTVTLSRYISEMEHFIAWGEKVRDLYDVYGDPRVKRAIMENYGKGMYDLVGNFLEDFARGGVNRAKSFDPVDWWRMRTTQVALAVRPAILVKQLTSTAAYLDSMPIEDFVAGVADFWSAPIEHTKILRESGFLQFRGQNIDRDIKAAMKSDAYKMFRQNSQSFVNRLMLNVQLGDQGAIIIGGWAVYRRSRLQGKSHEEALEEFARVSNRVQQSGDLARQSELQRGGSFAKLWTMFGTTPNEYLRRELAAVRNFRNERITGQEAAKTLMIYHFLLPMLFQWIADFGEFNVKRQVRAAILGNLNGLFMVGNLLENVVRAAIGERVYSDEIPIVSGAVRGLADVGKFINKATMESVTEEDVYKASKALLGVGGFVAGVPSRQIIDMIEGLKNIYDENYRQGIGGLMGWSENVLKEDAKSRRAL